MLWRYLFYNNNRRQKLTAPKELTMSKQYAHRNVIERFAWALLLTIPFAAISSYGQPPDHKAFREAVEVCAKENNISLPKPSADQGRRPSPPSEADRKVIDACLTAKGIELPKHPAGHACPPPEEEGRAPSQE
jgi:hypothetical protein